ncbi:hypothetical protein SBA2_900011 [Acidobacteriia bacterium SbA2]|nr:hypothetical protein SBA2_900011 [Acidobacteriia bacterium SbA2]
MLGGLPQRVRSTTDWRPIWLMSMKGADAPQNETSMDQLAPPGMADRILVWCYSESLAYTLERCDWCSADSFRHLHLEVAQFIKDQLDLFYADFSEYFNLADFPDVQEQLEPSEVAVFLKAAGAPDDADFSSIENYPLGMGDCFSGLRAVIRHRLDQRSLEQIKRAAELFNWTIDFGLFSCDTNAHAVLRVGSVEDSRSLPARADSESTSGRC